MASQEGSSHSTYSAIASPTTRPVPISRYFQHKFTDVVSKTRMTCRILRLAQQIKLDLTAGWAATASPGRSAKDNIDKYVPAYDAGQYIY